MVNKKVKLGSLNGVRRQFYRLGAPGIDKKAGKSIDGNSRGYTKFQLCVNMLWNDA